MVTARERAVFIAVLSGAISTTVAGTLQTGWTANPETVRRLAEKQPDINYDENRVHSYLLPDPLQTEAGGISTREHWTKRRTEIRELFRQHVYGRSPGPPEQLTFEPLETDSAAMGGAATLKRVAVVARNRGREHRFELTLFLPNAVHGPARVFLLLNNRPVSNTDPTRKERSGFWPAEDVIARGYGIAAVQNNQIAPDDRHTFRDGAMRLFETDVTEPRPDDAWGALAAWAWGASRAMDYFVTDPRVSAAHVALVGHSRGGKAALWAGAEDERFALVVSNESGEGGAALTRRNYGETLARITKTFPHWFAASYNRFVGREQTLPVDQHMLLALIAPRALYVASAAEDLWADPRGEFLSQVHASPVYALFGHPELREQEMPPVDRPLVAGPRGYHVRTGTHNLTPFDWTCFMDFADKVWGRPSAGTRR